MKRNISLLTMGAGNVKVLRKTLESFSGTCNEVIYGDMLLWQEDREILKSYQDEFNIKIIALPFNYLYIKGFSCLLNELASHASNDLVLYMNTSEVIDIDYGIEKIVSDNPTCNSFFFTHSQEKFRWFRCYDKRDLRWGGLIHESLDGDWRPFHKPFFMMKDLEKDMDVPYKSKVLNSLKECVYWNQLIKIVDNPELLDGTNIGWLQFAKDNYDSMKERLLKKGRQVEALEKGDLNLYFDDIFNNPDFANEIYKSSNLIAYQGDKIHLL